MAKPVTVTIVQERTTLTASKQSWVNAVPMSQVRYMDRLVHLSHVWIVDAIEMHSDGVHMTVRRISDDASSHRDVREWVLPADECIIVV